jgi:hypothetical protein
MTSAAFYDAFANVLVSHDLMHALYRDPERVRTKYGLSAEELRLLCSARRRDVFLSHAIVKSKRFRALELMLPESRRVLAEYDGDELLSGYVDDVLLRSDVDMLHAVTQARDFVSWLERRPAEVLPAGLLDLARFELTMLDLSGDQAAAFAARDRSPYHAAPARATALDADDRTCLVLCADARVQTFGIDVLALPAEVSLAALAAVADRPGGVLFRKLWGTRLPECFRVGTATAELLRLCDGRRTVDDVLTIVAADRPAVRARARVVLRDLTEQRVVRVSQPAATSGASSSEDRTCVSVPS